MCLDVVVFWENEILKLGIEFERVVVGNKKTTALPLSQKVQFQPTIVRRKSGKELGHQIACESMA